MGSMACASLTFQPVGQRRSIVRQPRDWRTRILPLLLYTKAGMIFSPTSVRALGLDAHSIHIPFYISRLVICSCIYYKV
jgi:hypothetical protein